MDKASKVTGYDRRTLDKAEALSLRRALEPKERAAAKDRKRKLARGSGKLPGPDKGQAMDKASAVTGYARRTLD